MVSKTASVFDIVNKLKDESDLGQIIVDNHGIIRYVSDDFKRVLFRKTKLRQGDNVYHSTLAACFHSPQDQHHQDIMTYSLDNKWIMKFEQMEVENGNTKWWLGKLLNRKVAEDSPQEMKWNLDTERLIQQISQRYAHEVLNALTPVYGILQMLKGDQENLAKYEPLLEVAEKEIIKGKNYVNDFLHLNFIPEPAPNWYRVDELKRYVEQYLSEQSPEFLPYINICLTGKSHHEVFVDKQQLRLVLQLLLKKWIDYTTAATTIEVNFVTRESGLFQVNIYTADGDDTLFAIDDEFMFYLHLVQQNMQKNSGVLKISEGIVLEYRWLGAGKLM